MYSMCCKCAQCTSAQFSCKLFSRAGMVIVKAVLFCMTEHFFYLAADE